MGGCKMFPMKISIRTIQFSKFVNFVPSDLKSCIQMDHVDWTYAISWTSKIGLPAKIGRPPPHDPPKPICVQMFYGTFEDLICLRQNSHCENGFTGHFQNGRQRK